MFCILIKNSPNFVAKCPIDNKRAFGLDSGLAPIRRQAIVWTNADPGFADAHDDVIKWKHFPRNWPFVREIHRSPVNSPHKGQWRGAVMFLLICIWINGWVNNRDAGDLRRQCNVHEPLGGDELKREHQDDSFRTSARATHANLIMLYSISRWRHVMGKLTRIICSQWGE